jgi:hypothetical protein
MENSQSKENKMKKNIIDKWLDKNGTKEIEKQVENEYKEIMKQTAVEWLKEKLRIEFGFAFSNNILEQAKEMEKEKIIDAYNQGCLDTLKDGMKRGEQYYNETFNK